MHYVDRVWNSADSWSYTERLAFVFNTTESTSDGGDISDLISDGGSGDSGEGSGDSGGATGDGSAGGTSGGDGDGSGSGSGDDGDSDGGNGPDLDHEGSWSSSTDTTRQTMFMMTFTASLGITTPSAAGVAWSINVQYGDTIGVSSEAEGGGVATPAPNGDSGESDGTGDNDEGDEDYSGEETPGGDNQELPDDFTAHSTWGASAGLTVYPWATSQSAVRLKLRVMGQLLAASSPAVETTSVATSCLEPLGRQLASLATWSRLLATAAILAHRVRNRHHCPMEAIWG